MIRTIKDSDGYCRAWAPTVPGCFAYAPSQQEAMDRLLEIIRGYLPDSDVAQVAHIGQNQAEA